MFIGTLICVMGTTLDLTLAIFYDPEIRFFLDPHKHLIFDIHPVLKEYLDFVSTLAWQIDAVLFIIADVLIYKLYKKDSKATIYLRELVSSSRWCSSSSSSTTTNEGEDSSNEMLPLLPDSSADRSPSSSSPTHYDYSAL